jgi:hypothetical protein
MKCDRCGGERRNVVDGDDPDLRWMTETHTSQQCISNLKARVGKLEVVASAARDDLASYKTVGDTPTGALYMAVSGVEAERRLIVLRDALRALDQ